MIRSATLSVLLTVSLGMAATALGQATRPAAPSAPLPAVSPEQEKKAEEIFEAGRKLFFQGQYKPAIEKIAQAIQANPAKSSYKLMFAKAHRHAGQDKEAVAVLEGILKETPDHVEAGVELSELLDPTKQPDRVIAVLEPLLKFKHDYPLYHLLAMAYTQKEQFDKAREHFEEAVRLNPRSGTDYEQLANIYLAQKRFAKAAEAYERAGGLGVDSAVYHFKLASVYFNLRNYLGVVMVAEVLGGKAGEIKNDLYLIEPAPITGADAAPAAANAPAALRPPAPSGPAKKDLFYVAGPRSAIFQAAKAQQMGVDMPQIRFLEANTWLSARRYAKADPLYKALDGKLEKTDQGLFWFYWAQTALGLDDLDNYLSRLNKAIEAEPEVYKPTLADAYTTIANRFQARGDAKKYIEFVAKAVDTNPLSPSLHLVLGDAYWQASQGKQAVEQYKLVLELEPDHPQRVRLLNRIRGEQDVPPAPTARN